MSAPDSPTVSGLPAEKLMAAALGSTPVSSPAFAWTPPAAEEIAPWFPDYEVQALLGRGAMGAVYRAVQRKLERPVAIKLLPPEIAAREGAAARFEREARAMARLQHPNIVALHDYGRTAEGHLFIVMEYVDGADLSRLIHAESGGLSVPHALEIVGQVCDALQYAHSRGFVHRDIKPGNVLVDTDGRVKIADFGLAKLLHTPRDTAATMTGQALGTPDYSAPEQLKGAPVDHRADIYSLGVMLYEMLTGDLPRGAWTPPSQRTTAPARLDEVVTRAMQTEPDKRYQQASEVKAAVTAREPAPAARAHDYSAVNRVMLWLMFAFIVASAFITPTGDMLTMTMLAAPFIALAVYFKLKRRPAGLVAVLIAGMAMGAAVLLAVVQIDESDRRTDRHDGLSVEESPAPQPSERAIADLNALINELADAQAGVEHERKDGFTRFWTGEEQQKLESKLKHLTDAMQPRINAGFAADDPLVKEAQQRYALLGKAFEEMKLPDVAPETCVSPEFRTGYTLNDYFPKDEDLLPGLRVHCWKGQHPADGAVYYVESSAIEPGRPAEAAKKKTLEHFPEFWPLEMPLDRPRLPAASPQSNAELEWIAKTWPKECAADGPGLVVAEFPLPVVDNPDPQLKWAYWSRSTRDQIPWAPGEPRAGGNAARGRIIFKGGECYTVFDTAPRPQLFGDTHVRAIVWAGQVVIQNRMGAALDQLIRPAEVQQPAAGEDWRQVVANVYSEFTAPDAARYVPEVAKKAPPWFNWRTEMSHLHVAKEMQAGTNTGESIPFHPWRGGRILATRFVCSRSVAEKIAAFCGARLPVPDSQEQLEELARLLPAGLMAHSGIVPGAAISGMWLETGDLSASFIAENTPAPSGLTIYHSDWAGIRGSAHLVPGLSRALLILEWPDLPREIEQAEKGIEAAVEVLKAQEEKVETARKRLYEVAENYGIVDTSLPPEVIERVKATAFPGDLTVEQARQRQSHFGEIKRELNSEDLLLQTIKAHDAGLKAKLEELKKLKDVKADKSQRRRVKFPD
jgi:hypothetical protein